MTQEFDPRAIIKKLAEWKRPIPDFEGDPVNGEGRTEVPFAALRVKCQNGHMSDGSCIYRHEPETNCEGRGWTPEPAVEKACWRILHVLYHLTKAHNISHMDFGGSSYPFVKRGDTDLVSFTQGAYMQGEWDEKDVVKAYGKSFEEALLRAAEAWMEA